MGCFIPVLLRAPHAPAHPSSVRVSLPHAPTQKVNNLLRCWYYFGPTLSSFVQQYLMSNNDRFRQNSFKVSTSFNVVETFFSFDVPFLQYCSQDCRKNLSMIAKSEIVNTHYETFDIWHTSLHFLDLSAKTFLLAKFSGFCFVCTTTSHLSGT